MFTAAIAGFSYIPATSSGKTGAFQTRSVAVKEEGAAPTSKLAPTPVVKTSSPKRPAAQTTPATAAATPAPPEPSPVIPVQAAQPRNAAAEVAQAVQAQAAREVQESTAAQAAPPPSPHAPAAPTASEPSTSVAPPQLKFPSAVTLAYSATSTRRGQPSQGNGLLSWRSDGQRYEIKLDSSALLVTVLAQSSVGSLTPLGLAPERFADKRMSRPEQATHFRAKTDSADSRIEFSSNKAAVRWLPGAQDRLSLLVQLAALVAGQPERYGAGSSITAQVANTAGADVWDIKVVGMEAVSTPAGEFQALKLQRLPRSEYDQMLQLWLAPSLAYLPVRVLQSATEDAANNSFELVLRKMP